MQFAEGDYLLEEQFELPDGSALIWIVDGGGYDDGLHIYLIGKDSRVCDAIEGGITFVPAILKIKNFGNNWVDFEFFNNGKSYRLEVANKPKFRLCLPLGWRYKKLFAKHRLKIREIN